MILKSVWLPCDVARAFELFTEHAAEWWPESHRPSKDATSEILMSPDGRFVERRPGAEDTPLGAVTAWEPPFRLTLDFYIGSDPAHPTDVTVLFRVEGAGTRVTVEHRPTPRSGDVWSARAPVFARSWEAVLAALARAASRRCT